MVVTLSCKSSVGEVKFVNQRPTFYHCATQPIYCVTIHVQILKVLLKSVQPLQKWIFRGLLLMVHRVVRVAGVYV